MKKIILFITFITMLARCVQAEQNEPKIVKIYIMDAFLERSRGLPRIVSGLDKDYTLSVFYLKGESGPIFHSKPFYYTPEKLALTNDFELNTGAIPGNIHYWIPPYKYKFSLSNNMLNVSVFKQKSWRSDRYPYDIFVHSYSYTFEPTPSNEFVLILGPHTGGWYGEKGYLPVVNMVPYDSPKYQEFEKMLKNYPNLFEGIGLGATFYDYLRALFDPKYPNLPLFKKQIKKIIEEPTNTLRHDRLENFEAIIQSLE